MPLLSLVCFRTRDLPFGQHSLLRSLWRSKPRPREIGNQFLDGLEAKKLRAGVGTYVLEGSSKETAAQRKKPGCQSKPI